MRIVELALCALLLAVTSEAHAHLRVESHTSRLTQSDQKVGPCGKANSTWGAAKIYSYAPGETIKVEINEYIAHPGWFRISFDKDGDDDFKSPKSIDPPSFMDNEAVLMDNLNMHQSGGGKRSYDVKLPDVECEKCTLQIIQVMLDKPPYDPQDTGAFSNDIYYACIDLQLKRAGGGGQADAGTARDAAVVMPTSDAATPSSASDAGLGEQPPESKPPTASTRDAGRGSSGGDASSGGAVKRDAGVAPPPSQGDDEEEHQHDDEGDEEEDEEDTGSSESSDDGCSVSSERSARDLTLPLGLLLMLGAATVSRRRKL